MWAYSFDNQYYTGKAETRDLAIKAAAEEAQATLDARRRNWNNPDIPGRRMKAYVGECDFHKPRLSSCCDIIEHLEEQAIDSDFGEHADGWLDGVTSEQVQELEDAIDAAVNEWLKKNKLEPSFYLVRAYEEVEIVTK